MVNNSTAFTYSIVSKRSPTPNAVTPCLTPIHAPPTFFSAGQERSLLIGIRDSTITPWSSVSPTPTHWWNPSNLRDINLPKLLLYRRTHVIGQLARDLCCVNPPYVLVDALPLCNPRLAGVCDGDEPLKDLRSAAVDLVGRALKMEKLFAVGTPLVSEALLAWSA